MPSEVAVLMLELGNTASGYGWRIDSAYGVVKVHSSRDGCMLAVNPQRAREIARAFHNAVCDAADLTEVRSYGQLYRGGEGLSPAALDALTRAKEPSDA